MRWTAGRRRLVASSIGFALALTLVGCSATSSYELSVSEARSAVESARLALELVVDGRSTRAVAATAVSDAVDQVIGAESALAETRASDDAESERQRVARELVHEASTALIAAEQELADGAPMPDQLTDLGDRLDALDTSLREAL